MSNVLSDEKKQQVLALGRLGWTLRSIEQATGVRRETASNYLKAAGIEVHPPGRRGRRLPAKPANKVITDPGSAPADSKPAIEVITDFCWEKPPKPAIETTTTDSAPAKPAIHDRYLSRTDGVVLTLLPTEAFSIMLLTGRALSALSEAHLYSCSALFGLEFFPSPWVNGQA